MVLRRARQTELGAQPLARAIDRLSERLEEWTDSDGPTRSHHEPCQALNTP